MKPIVVASLALVLGTALLAGCTSEEPAAPAPVAEPAAPPAPVEPAEPAVDASAPTDAMTDPDMPADGGESMDEDSDTPHSGGDKV